MRELDSQRCTQFGVMWDLVDDPRSAALLSTLHVAGVPIALVGQGVAVLRRATDPSHAARSSRAASGSR
jgi:hypothetical protein